MDIKISGVRDNITPPKRQEVGQALLVALAMHLNGDVNTKGTGLDGVRVDFVEEEF